MNYEIKICLLNSYFPLIGQEYLGTSGVEDYLIFFFGNMLSA